MSLNAFLVPLSTSEENVEYIVSKRFTVDGEPQPWVLRSLTADEDQALRKLCTQRVQVPGKKNVYLPETDFNEYITKLVVACVVSPDLNNKELQDFYKVMGAEKVLKSMLKPGEYADLSTKVQEINGFDVTTEELKEEAKNS